MTQEPQSSYVINAESAAEMARLLRQEQILSEATQSAYPPIDRAKSTMILDLACGPGGWVFKIAEDYPRALVIGVDISQRMIEYAQAQSETRNLPNATFRLMDITQGLDFADDLFDLVNVRYLFGVLSSSLWPQMLAECVRIVKPGGLIQLTEPEFPLTTSLATEKLYTVFLRALQQTGRSLFPAPSRTLGITVAVRKYLQEAGCHSIETHASCIDYSAKMKAHDIWCENTEIGFSLLTPYLVKQGVASTEEMSQLLEQLRYEHQADGFYGVLFLLSVLGKKPAKPHSGKH